jgi:DNA-binding MarR family transcriptional regulator
MTLHLSRLSRFKSPYDILGYMLRLLSALWHRELNARLGEVDLTEIQFVILMGLGWIQEVQTSGVSQRELARSCSLSPALASQVIKSLLRKKLVATARDRADGRAHIITLTRLGEERIRAALQIVDEVDVTFWRDVPDLAGELSAVLKSLIATKLGPDEDGRLCAMPGLMQALPSEPEEVS